jgi:hypothetical protein
MEGYGFSVFGGRYWPASKPVSIYLVKTPRPLSDVRISSLTSPFCLLSATFPPARRSTYSSNDADQIYFPAGGAGSRSTWQATLAQLLY